MFENIIRNKKPIPERLAEYGFESVGDCQKYSTEICDGEFELTVFITPKGEISTELAEVETGEQYVLYKTSSTGAFVGKIRSEIEQVISSVAQKCYDASVFKSEQTKRIVEFVKAEYSDELEFLWEKSPQNAIWRRKDNRKWYGGVFTVKKDRLGFDSPEYIEIIDLRMKPADADKILSREHYYPGWHMNKKSWYTLILDGSVPDEEIRKRISESYALSKDR